MIVSNDTRLAGPTPITTLTQPPKMPVGDVLADRRFSALTNVLVFTPYAVYLARGKRPPAWLIAASLTYLAVSFFEDMRYLVQGEQIIEAELSAFPPRQCPPLGCANGCGCASVPPATSTSFPQAMQYRVNR